MQDFATPSREKGYMGSKKSEEFLVKHMLETNRSAAQILKDSNSIARQATQGFKGVEHSEPFTSRSAQMYTKQGSLSKESDAASLSSQAKKPALTRMKTVENVGKLVDDRHAGLDHNQKQLEELREVVGDKNRGGHSLGNTVSKLDRFEAKALASFAQEIPRNAGSANKDFYQVTLNELPVSPLVAQRSAKIDEILKDWENKLAVSEKKLSKDKQAREVLAADLTLMEEELRKVKAKLHDKTQQLGDIDSLLSDTREATERITRSMQGLTTVLEREKQLRFK